ncbi:hypothetical protein [Piscinibacter sp.]|uniref:hypothetical protein n=1 Tax=Piscinibacter sp. TaxID=1903157 RepID=UPI0039E2E94A
MRFPTVPACVLTLAACSPALDWREFQPEGSGLVAGFPCKPDRHSRQVALAVQPVRMELLACDAGGAKFALGWFDVDDPARVTAALGELRERAAGNLGAAPGATEPAAVPGMTPNPQALRLRLEARQGDGVVLQQQTLLFSKGLRVYQATLLGPRIGADAAQAFFGALRFPA